MIKGFLPLLFWLFKFPFFPLAFIYNCLKTWRITGEETQFCKLFPKSSSPPISVPSVSTTQRGGASKASCISAIVSSLQHLRPCCAQLPLGTQVGHQHGSKPPSELCTLESVHARLSPHPMAPVQSHPWL